MRVILTPEPADQVVVVCEWCGQPLRLTLPPLDYSSDVQMIARLARGLLLHKRVGCVYSERARALA